MDKPAKDLLETFATASRLRNEKKYQGALAAVLPLAEKYPQDAQVQNLAAHILADCGRFKEAAARWQGVPQKDAYALGRLAYAFLQSDDYAGARRSLEEALTLEPQSVLFLYNLARACHQEGDFDAAVRYYRQTLDIDPTYADALHNLMFILHYQPQHTAKSLAQEAMERGRRYAAAAALPLPFAEWRPDNGRPLRIGLVSGDLAAHPVGYFVESLLASRAAAQFDWYAYHNSDTFDALGRRIRPVFAEWHMIRDWEDRKVVNQIREDGIDILIDLSGHTAKSRHKVFANCAAPVQAAWAGYFATTGLPSVNCILADPYCVPPEEEELFCEKVYRLPHTRLCMNLPEHLPEVQPLPALKNGFVTFGSFQNVHKINDFVIQTWGEIARRVPDARWRLQSHPTRPGAAADHTVLLERIRGKMAAAGIPDGQIVLAPAMPHAEYLRAYQEVDLVLDTFPYPGGTTTAEALLMGVPTLTLARPGMLGRQGEQIMSAAGLPGFVARSREEYIEQAVRRSRPEKYGVLNAMRLGMRAQVSGSPLFDRERFGEDWCRLVRQMWAEEMRAPKVSFDEQIRLAVRQ